MMRGSKTLIASGCLAAAACAQTQSVKVRAIADPAAKERFGGGLLSDARGQLALGDVGTALETFRTLSRQQPENPDAFAGIAACYAAMGRYDIARQNYEFALAYAPNDPELLLGLADSLERLGLTEQASQARAEVATLRAASAALASEPQSPVTPPGVPRLSSVTVKLPPPSPVTHSQAPPRKRAPVAQASTAAVQTAPEQATTSPDRAFAKVSLSQDRLAPTATRFSSNVKALSPAPGAPRQAPAVAVASGSSGVAVKISSAAVSPKRTPPVQDSKVVLPVRLDELLDSAPTIATSQAMPFPFASKNRTLSANADVIFRSREKALNVPTPAPSRQFVIAGNTPHDAVVEQSELRVESGPLLQRLSSAEVLLVTTPSRTRVEQSLQRLPRGASIEQVDGRINIALGSSASTGLLHWIPLKYASAIANVQLLNAAHSPRLAAHARLALLGRGWRNIGIGNAQIVRQHSVVLYSPARLFLARRLAAQFHCKALKVKGIKNVLVLLGRDAASARRISERA